VSQSWSPALAGITGARRELTAAMISSVSIPWILRNDRAVADAAMSAIGELAEHSDGYHRVPLTDALIAAAATEHGGIALLHRDTHFDKLAKVLTFENVKLPEP
jgi:predicted nucleic acid-binding protein